MRYKPYSKYKPSAVEWFGEIPTEWEVMPLKRLGDFQAGAGFPDDEQGQEDGDLPFYKVSDMNLPGNDLHMISHNNAVSNETAKALRAFIFPIRTIIFAKVGAALLLNKRRILTRPSCVDNNTMGFIPQSCDLHWIYFWMCGLDLGKLANPGAVPSINEGQLREILIPIPPAEDQKAIGDFLLSETKRIDQLIAKKERQIELLQEKRSALITHAVTTGLNPKAKMKDSGIEWLGKMPAHWDVKRIKHVAMIRGGQVDPRDRKYDDMLFVAPNHIESRTGRLLSCETTEEQGAISGKYFFQKGDVLYSKIRPALAKACIAHEDGLCSADMYAIVPRSGNYSKFLLYLLLSEAYTKLAVDESMRVVMPKINREELGDIRWPFPPENDQKGIAEYIEAQTKPIDKLMEKIISSVDKLREYRTALISAAITGKIDIREEVA